MAKTATFIREMEGWRGRAALYRLSDPLTQERWHDEDEPTKSFDHVVVSATNVMYSGPETYIFGANDKGEVLEWGELPGSFRGALNHEAALSGAGYQIASEAA